MYVENGVKSIKGLGQMQILVGVGGLQPPPPPKKKNWFWEIDFESIFFNCSHKCYYVQVIAIWGGGGGLAPIKLI